MGDTAIAAYASEPSPLNRIEPGCGEGYIVTHWTT